MARMRRTTRTPPWNGFGSRHNMMLVWNHRLRLVLLVRDWLEVLTPRRDLGSWTTYPRRLWKTHRMWWVWRNPTRRWHLIDLHPRLTLHQASRIVSKTIFHGQGVPVPILSVSLVWCLHLLVLRWH